MQLLGADANPAAVARQPLLKALLVDQPANAIPRQSPQHGAEQPRHYYWQQGQLALLHIKAPEGHDQFGGDRREEVLKEHRRKDRSITKPGIGLHCRTDQLRQLLHQFANPHRARLSSGSDRACRARLPAR